MVSRDDRRAVVLATRRTRGQGRTVVRRGFAPIREPVGPVEPIEPVAPVKKVEQVEQTGSGGSVATKKPRRAPVRKPRLRSRLRKQKVTPRGRWAVRLLAVALAGALAAAGVLGRQWYDQRELDTARQQALAAARQMTVDFVSISAASIDQDLKRIADGATGEFRDELTRDMPQVRAAVLENKVQSKGTVLRAALVSADAHSAVALVALDATVQNTNAPNGRLSHYRIQVSLARDAGSGRWLVSQLQFVG
jgi:Mce-associated membrane protein